MSDVQSDSCPRFETKNTVCSQEAKSGLRYDPVLVQSMFLHGVLTGLLNDSVRSELQPYLQQTNGSEELLLEKLNIAYANETERKSKKKLLTQMYPTVFAVQSADTPPDKKKKDQNAEHSSKAQPDLLNKLKEICSYMALLKNLGTEVAEIRESIKQPSPAQTKYLASNVMQECIHARTKLLASPRTRTWVDRAQYQQRFGLQCYYPAPGHACLRKCIGCQQGGNEYCTHCYTNRPEPSE